MRDPNDPLVSPAALRSLRDAWLTDYQRAGAALADHDLGFPSANPEDVIGIAQMVAKNLVHHLRKNFQGASATDYGWLITFNSRVKERRPQ